MNTPLIKPLGPMKLPPWTWAKSNLGGVSLTEDLIEGFLPGGIECDTVHLSDRPGYFDYNGNPPLIKRPQGSWGGTLLLSGSTTNSGSDRKSKLNQWPILYTQGMYNVITNNEITRKSTFINIQTGSCSGTVVTAGDFLSFTDSYDPDGPEAPNVWNNQNKNILLGIIRRPNNNYFGKPRYTTILPKIISLDSDLGLTVNDYLDFANNNSTWLDTTNITIAIRPNFTTWPGGGFVPTDFDLDSNAFIDPTSFIAGKIYEITSVAFNLGQIGRTALHTFDTDIINAKLIYGNFAKRRIRTIYFTDETPGRDDMVNSAISSLTTYGYAPVDNMGQIDFDDLRIKTISWLNSLIPDMKQFFNVKR